MRQSGWRSITIATGWRLREATAVHDARSQRTVYELLGLLRKRGDALRSRRSFENDWFARGRVDRCHAIFFLNKTSTHPFL